jgi:lysyl oxidase
MSAPSGTRRRSSSSHCSTSSSAWERASTRVSLDAARGLPYARHVWMLAALAALLVGVPQPPRLPNLVELPPASLEVRQADGRSILRFTSTVANLGEGPLAIVSTRSTAVSAFASAQLLERPGGSPQRISVQVRVRYRRSGGHEHFHLLGFERYELRTAAGRVLLRGRKAGYCLEDRRQLVTTAGPPRWAGSCGRGRPGALALAQGISPGYADPYDADLGGQGLDITGLPRGEYVLVNVVNPDHALRETRVDDDAASVRFALARPPAPAGIAFVRVLATCRSDTCTR